MPIELPPNLEFGLKLRVDRGEFASLDEAAAEAVRFFLSTDRPKFEGDPAANGGMGSIGAMQEDAELLDEIVQHAMRLREWWSRPMPDDFGVDLNKGD